MTKLMMQAVQVHEYGSEDSLNLEEIERPQPAAGDVLVKIRYAAVLPLDWKIRNGWLHDFFPKAFPYTPGSAISGIVEAIGADVADLQKGDRVFGNAAGAFAEYSLAEANDLVPMPDSLSFEDAASINGGAITAWKALFLEGELKPDQTVLIHAAAGGVGQYAVQLAKWKGAKVIGTASTANLDYVKQLDADQVIDYTTTAFEESVKAVDLVIDLVGGETENRSWPVLKKGGTLISLVQPPSAENAEKFGITAKFNAKFPTKKDLETVAGLIADGTLKSEIDSIYPLSDVKKAFAKSEARHSRGRILLQASSI